MFQILSSTNHSLTPSSVVWKAQLREHFEGLGLYGSIIVTMKYGTKLWNRFNFVVFDVLTAVVRKISVFYDIMSCSPLKVKRHFGGKRRLHFQGRSCPTSCLAVPPPPCFYINPIFLEAYCTAYYMLHSGFFVSVFFDPEDGSDIFLRNVGWLSTDYTTSYARRYNSRFN
jgi:hypothetical protein